jgi:cutinase
MRLVRLRFRSAVLNTVAGGLMIVTIELTGASAVAAAPAANAAACSDLDVVAARGTGEPGTLGLIVGDPVYSALRTRLTGKSLSSYAVDYPAGLASGSASEGNQDLVDHVTQQAAACPGQRFVLVGYSQGANVVANSIGISSVGAVVGGPIVATIPAALEPRIAVLLVFGPPIGALGKHITGTYQSRSAEYCAQGDPVCQAGGQDVLAHLSYGNRASEAALFAASKV